MAKPSTSVPDSRHAVVLVDDDPDTREMYVASEKALGAGCTVVRLKPYLPDAMVTDIEAMMRGDRLKPFPPQHDAIHGN